MVRRWLWLPGLITAVLLLAAAVAPKAVSAQRTVNLVVGCNPVAITYDDGTSVTTVATGVQPDGSLVSIWKYLPAENRWIGYSAGAPAAVSDLQTVERLDALFVCVNAVATISMPDIGGGG
jgi:hypothetical protein